ncbi:lipoprotein-releasing system ATP-binding protein LolD [Candidatus Desantisbacteria bacterium CG_4_9_14_3_um_filter_40_11]|uniref:Lipoprotein-releasing system ATP-binding protein LolD n=4 Tax=unclassified Candidatus Desantisiibacteriota TaxID=3106372 RepID=A0A2M7J8H5_9BACT|nr:MAG: lipoprotein-releasing system ATP-binding protein LolD [Candidatus Desantisbacteria bacterium CG23_combo_of_CG06-09_8_20_14_all_40_23]PIX15682.1 MAG: lipoprotein-releasing system ATP-binding protein LolD [Candidatus Desantisbacteria bacterium CG_4_8_14_3_um_filter_40_12]PIY19348.1 MAG: lipoprotein-releasing system ATP-binding protein LolD [Candidatus Desantisbacteria bacterium CG_4_10_14_3_um_filter_40_18]PJB29553.1 MAG: lipoprotein-releasing system ATP-binding protein LolD [Candidatus De
MSVVRVLNIVREYKLGKTKLSALRGVSIEIERGEFVAICGPSGSGKTTLLNIIGCLDKPTTGTVQIVNQEILTLSDRKLSELRNKSIGFIFQNFNLMPVLTAYENVEYPLWILGKSTIERKRMVLKMLEEVGLLEHKNHKPDELSGGQRQRVAIARALVTMPSIVLADEPTANLDSQTGATILELMRKMNEEFSTTFIFSTHDQQVVSYARRVYHIRDGRIQGDNGG